MLLPLLLAMGIELELGFHRGAIKSLAVDAAEKYLVTASLDKTVRVWDVASGKQLQVWYAPVGEDADIGKMYTAAIAPDGETIAAGGWTGPETHSIYIFERATGRMVRRLDGLPGVTLHLAYSPDGRYLLAALGAGGIRLYRTAGYGLAAEDRGYEGNCFHAAFQGAGQFATAAEDGYVRLYRVGADGRMRVVRRRKGREAGDRPVNLAFSPDGRKLAVAFDYEQYPVVEVWDAGTLAPGFRVEAGTLGGETSSVAWSRDGRFLYGAGGHGFARNAVARWEGGRGEPVTVEVGDEDEESSISAILPLRDGRVVVATAFPGLGLVNSKFEVERLESAPIPGFLGLDLNGKFLVSEDGQQVRFAYRQQGRDPAWFSVAEKRLVAGEKAAGFSGRPPKQEGIEVMGIGSAQVLIDRKVMPLLEGEVGTCYAVSPESDSVLLGTQWRLVLLDGQRNERWQIPVEAAVAAAHFSGDGRLAIAALRDGTVRWYRTSDGRELRAFFAHPDRKRWVMWTPEGTVAAGEGGEGLIRRVTQPQ